MAELKWDLETVDALLERTKEKGVSKLKLKSDEFEIVIENTPAAQVVSMGPAPVVSASSTAQQESGDNMPQETGNIMRSPLIGTFYSSPSPDDAPFVSIGQQVKKGDVLFIIESMKLMNEIKCDYNGTVRKILVQNGDSVDYNQPIMVIE